MRIILSGLVVSSLIGCTTSDPVQLDQQEQPTGTTPMPTSSGSYLGHYQVPTPTNLSTAATFGVPEVDWSVVAGVATLHYDLPVGLVGGNISVSLSGALATGAATVTLTAGSGTGSCAAQGNIITCSENFDSLGALPVNPTIVQQTATQDSVAPMDRMAVASLFGVDPIGTVTFDLSQAADDHGGHGGGGGGGGGGSDSGGGGGSDGGGGGKGGGKGHH